LTQAGHEVHVVCPRGDRYDRSAYEYIDGVAIHRYPLRAATGGVSGFLREYPSALWRSIRITRKLGHFDVVHICNPPDLLWTVALLFKMRGSRVVFDQHDLCPELYLSRFERGRDPLYYFVRLLERITYGVADLVIATNESYAAVARGRGRVDSAQVAVVRSAPDLSKFSGGSPDPDLKGGTQHLLHFHGVMGPQDGVDYALRALAELRKCRVDWKASFAGDGDVRPAMISLAAELGLEECVEFPGRVPDQELLNLMATADLGLSPDPLNPLNDVSTMNKILEYMAAGLPVVSFDLREARASAGEAAVYVAPNDPTAFAGEIDRLLDDPDERRSMGEEGLRRLERDLSWSRSAEALTEAYRTVLAPS